ncbi:glycosyltransferase family 9 protein [Spirosoma sp. 209]|uniref:glycosyltransferase family 9 protein n=1 Tax=Spirosoma sp. 209 TaxID=1955701 RepID=UPI00098D0A37|nr:glycosyltransferase family 9 protein [Spirosoma sp. 209]
MASPVKILVLQFASIGDMVLASPVVRCLKQQIHHAEIHICTKRAYLPIVEHNPYIDKRHYAGESPTELIQQLRAERFDLVVDLQNNVLTAFLKAALMTRSYSVRTFRLRQWLYQRWKVNVIPPQHVVDRYFEALAPLGIEDDEMGLDYFIPYKDQVEPDWLPASHQHNYVAYAIGGRHQTARMPVAKMVELCRKINFPIVLLGDKADRVFGDEVARALGNQLIYNACGQFNLNQSASIIQGARVVFSHDTGLMQIAAAFAKRVYSIWGSTMPGFGRFPYRTPYVRLEKLGLSCRPCTVGTNGTCPLKHFRCMNDISFDFVVKELQKKKKNFE